ncbi:unnamed protein product [Porites evermanni]|uniref:Uncharacterized protein n=1 Tax=Porites evermanni TaxID=104178 RepID=A0ABN8R974_9CNID|nr:unnamed protein product [Porites evermanni]
MSDQVPVVPADGAVAADVDPPVVASPAPADAAGDNNAQNANDSVVPAPQPAAPEGYENLRQIVESLQSALNVSKVNQSLESVRLLASRTAALLDPFTLLAALEQLSDHAREAKHTQRKKFDAIFKQCRPLANSNSFAKVVLQILGDKEEKDVASQIRKIFKGHSSPRSSGPGQAFDF